MDKLIKELTKIKKINAIYFFGSTAKRTARNYSDVDVYIVAGKLTEKEREKTLSLASKKIDLTIFSDLPILMQYRIIKEGKLIYKKDKFNFLGFLRNTTVSYLDFRWVIEKQTKSILGV